MVKVELKEGIKLSQILDDDDCTTSRGWHVSRSDRSDTIEIRSSTDLCVSTLTWTKYTTRNERMSMGKS